MKYPVAAITQLLKQSAEKGLLSQSPLSASEQFPSEFENIIYPVVLSDSVEIMPHLIKMYGWSCMGKGRKAEPQYDG